MWAKNCWYVIAWEHEIPSADSPKLFTRTLLNEPILVYRTSAGALTAMEDRCPHRHAPLSAGRKEGDSVRCGYHGLKFNPQGQCSEVPGMEQVPSKICTRTYPVASKNNWIFVWMGEASRADEALLPDNFSCASPAWKNIPGYLHYDTPYLLICDNLLDFSHLSYVHEKTLGGSTAIAQSRPLIEAVTTPGQRGIKVTRHVPNVPAPPFYQRFRKFNANLDRWFIYEFLMPGTLLMHSGGRPVTDAASDLSNAVQLHSCQTLSPETENSTHYFFQQSHQAGLGDAAVTQSIYDSLVVAFEEDRAMISAQHRNLAHPGAAPMVPLHFDSALVQFRKLIEREVAMENAEVFNT
jgi:phenylpropionate dioxygenase-like ring-hydroxylating dioxygenase large terminal subunit